MQITTSASSIPENSTFPNRVLSQDFDTFLRMLTTQIRNQDPLSPLDSSDFSIQLATFSLVEQQSYTNTVLEQLVSIQEASNLSVYASFQGKTVSHVGGVEFSGEPIQLSVHSLSRTGSIGVQVLSESGSIVSEEEAHIDDGIYVWNGLNSEGDAVEPGRYFFQAVSSDDPSAVVSSVGVIDEVRRQNNEIRFVLSDGSAIGERDIVGLR